MPDKVHGGTMKNYENRKQAKRNIKLMLIVFTCLTMDSSKTPPTVTFVTSKRILTGNSVINARVVKALVNICKIKRKNCVWPSRKTTRKTRLKSKVFV